MKMFFAVAIVATLASAAYATVWTTVYRFDGVTPLPAIDPNQPTVYPGIMVGTHLVLVVSSDSDRAWAGYMVTSLEDAEYGTLNARGYVGRKSLYPGSCLDAAGMDAEVQTYGGGAAGYDLSTAYNWGVPAWDPVAGDWFVLDYQAVKVGACDVMLWAHDFDEGSSVLLQTLSFTHVPSRDFHPDRVVDFKDFAALSSQWRTMSDSDPNGPITAADLNSDRRVDAQDLALFAEYWLERTDQIESADPNSPPVQP